MDWGLDTKNLIWYRHGESNSDYQDENLAS